MRSSKKSRLRLGGEKILITKCPGTGNASVRSAEFLLYGKRTEFLEGKLSMPWRRREMIQVEEHLLPMAFARAVDLDSTFAYMGSLMTFLAKGSETGGRFALMEYHTKPGNEPPPHVHEREHELYFVLEGTMRFYCEDKTLDIGAGEVVFLPQGKPHAFACTSAVVRTLIFVQATGQ